MFIESGKQAELAELWCTEQSRTDGSKFSGYKNNWQN